MARAFGALVAAALLITATPAGAGSHDASGVVWSRHEARTILGVRTHRRIVALSFDDGPSKWTPFVLDQLARYHDRATFFVEGQFVQANPDLARLVVQRGNEIGNHTFSHPDLPRLSAAQVEAEINQANAAYAKAGLPKPHFFRPPKGHYDAEDARGVAATGLTNIEWTGGLCLEKWTRRSGPDQAVQAMLARVRPGDILLAHDGGIPNRTATMKALPLLLEGLRAKGYEVVTVGQLLALTGQSF